MEEKILVNGQEIYSADNYGYTLNLTFVYVTITSESELEYFWTKLCVFLIQLNQLTKSTLWYSLFTKLSYICFKNQSDIFHKFWNDSLMILCSMELSKLGMGKRMKYTIGLHKYKARNIHFTKFSLSIILIVNKPHKITN